MHTHADNGMNEIEIALFNPTNGNDGLIFPVDQEPCTDATIA